MDIKSTKKTQTTFNKLEGSHKLVPALARGVSILDVVATSKQNLTITEIAARVGLAKSSVHGLCKTLIELNLLVCRTGQTYFLGPHVMRWANRFVQESDLAIEFVRILDESSQLPGATITLSVLEGSEVVYLAVRNSKLPVGFDFHSGMLLPAAFTATGKSLLSYMSDTEVRKLIGNSFPEPLTDHSVQDFSQLMRELKQIRGRGYSIDNQQVKDGMICFGASVLNSENRPIAGVAVSLSQQSVDKNGEDLIVRSVQEIARKMSFRLGAEL